MEQSRCGQLTFVVLALFAPVIVIAANPKVRAITAFIHLDPARYEAQIAETVLKLRESKASFEKSGYAVQTVRITTQPFPRYIEGMSREAAIALLLRVEELAVKQDVLLNIGPAALDDQPDPRALEVLGEVHGRGTLLDASMIVASESGVHWNTVRAAARHVLRAAKSPRSQGTFGFAATALLPPGAPFFPGSWHVDSAGRFSVGLQSANVVAEAFARSARDPQRAYAELSKALAAHVVNIHRIAAEVEGRTGLRYWGLDPTPAPLKDDSIGAGMEALHGATFGSAGTMTAAWVITESQRQLPGPLIGYSGLMLPVMEDARLAQRWNEGRITLDSLLAYSAVCGTGLDTVPLPGDVTEDQLARIIGDVAVLAFKWRKPLTARLQPVSGRKAGEMSAFDDPFLINVRLQPVR